MYIALAQVLPSLSLLQTYSALHWLCYRALNRYRDMYIWCTTTRCIDLSCPLDGYRPTAHGNVIDCRPYMRYINMHTCIWCKLRTTNCIHGTQKLVFRLFTLNVTTVHCAINTHGILTLCHTEVIRVLIAQSTILCKFEIVSGGGILTHCQVGNVSGGRRQTHCQLGNVCECRCPAHLHIDVVPIG